MKIISLIAFLFFWQFAGLTSLSAYAGTSYSAEKIADMYFDAARFGRVDILSGLLKAGAPLEARNKKGYTAFILAAYNNQSEAAGFLAMRGADVCARDGRGNTAQMGVAFAGHDDMARTLLTYDCDVDMQNKNGQTALMMAALFGRVEQVKLLLAAGAAADKADRLGNTAISLARQQGNDEMLALLQNKDRNMRRCLLGKCKR